jgi:threonine dehydratase
MSAAPSSPSRISPAAIAAAGDRIAGAVAVTPCPQSIALSDLTGCRVFCKLDYLQRTGSFKERGAANALLQLTPDQQSRGVIAASAGNHALALAWHGQRLAIPVTVVMPRFAPLIKAATCRRLGARVVSHGDSFAQARAHADELVQAEHLTYVHGFDDPHVIAGQGTLGLELLEQVPDLHAVIVPVGGGGLIAGVATAIKAQRPDIQIIGVEPQRMPSFTAALNAGQPVTVAAQPTLADGLAVGRVGDNAFAAARDKVDRVVCVDEGHLALAVLRLLELEKAVVEGAGAASLAALLSGALPELGGKTVALPLCGGNIDPITLHRVIAHGLAADGRLHHLTITISDRPGGLAALTRVLADADASIQDIRHDRAFSGPDVASVRVEVILETRDREHFQAVCQALAPQFPVTGGA